jgi:hypothetical protein
MSFLDGLFVDTSTELGVAPGLITLDATIEVGWIYQVGDSEGPCVLSLAPVPIADVVGHRIAVKVVRDGGGVMVIVPEGMTIEGDGGAVSGQVEVPHEAGQYREWICNASGLWLLVAGAAGGGGGDTGGGDGEPNPHVWTHADGGLDELDVTGLSGVLADPQPPAPHASTHAAGGSDEIVIAAGPPTAHAATHADGGADEINVAGLSGVLADPQPPAAHAATHAPGGSDPIAGGGDITAIITPGPVLAGGAASGDVTLAVRAAVAFAYAVTVQLDTAAAFNFRQSNTMTGDMAIQLTNPVTDREGAIWIRQDATGNRNVSSVTAAGYTTMSASGTIPIDKAASAVSVITYALCDVGGAKILYLGVITLKPVP